MTAFLTVWYAQQLVAFAVSVVGVMMGFYSTVLSFKTYTGARLIIGLVLATLMWIIGASVFVGVFGT
jgi:hypothetical protein